jgi:hypothetical protein
MKKLLVSRRKFQEPVGTCLPLVDMLLYCAKVFNSGRDLARHNVLTCIQCTFVVFIIECNYDLLTVH